MVYSVKNLACFFIPMLLLGSCISEDINDSFTDPELRQLLANDSAKVWTLTDRQPDALMPCESDDLLIFWRSEIINDSITLKFTNGELLCQGQTDSLLYEGSWDLLEATSADTLLVIIDGDTNKRAIDFITSQSLQLSYQIGNDQVIEFFSFTP